MRTEAYQSYRVHVRLADIQSLGAFYYLMHCRPHAVLCRWFMW